MPALHGLSDMAKETEHKFLVDNQLWGLVKKDKPANIHQAYIDLTAPGQQVNITEDGRTGHIEFVGPEFSAMFTMPLALAREMRQVLTFSDPQKGTLAAAHGQNIRIRRSSREGGIMEVTWAVKRPTDHVTQKDEFEAEIPATQTLPAAVAVDDILKHMKHDALTKKRYKWTEPDGHVWEVDQFGPPLAPHIDAQVELKEINEAFTVPSFVAREQGRAREITGAHAYSNATMARTGQVPVQNAVYL